MITLTARHTNHGWTYWTLHVLGRRVTPGAWDDSQDFGYCPLERQDGE